MRKIAETNKKQLRYPLSYSGLFVRIKRVAFQQRRRSPFCRVLICLGDTWTAHTPLVCTHTHTVSQVVTLLL